MSGFLKCGYKMVFSSVFTAGFNVRFRFNVVAQSSGSQSLFGLMCWCNLDGWDPPLSLAASVTVSCESHQTERNKIADRDAADDLPLADRQFEIASVIPAKEVPCVKNINIKNNVIIIITFISVLIGIMRVCRLLQ